MPALRTRSHALISSIGVGSVLLGGAPACADNGIEGGTSGPPRATDTHRNADGNGTLSDISVAAPTPRPLTGRHIAAPA